MALTVRAGGCGPVDKIGAGFVVGSGNVMTTAHTLRGSTTVRVEQKVARVVFMDHRTDIAVLQVGPESDSDVLFAKPVLGPARLMRRDSSVQRAGAIQVQVVRVAPINIEEPIDSTNYRRDGFVATLLDGSVSVGDSGSPVLDASGAVIGMVFATDTATGHTAYAVSSTELQQALDQTEGKAVSTGPCPD